VEELDVDPAALEEAQAAVEESSAVLAEGLLARAVSGIDAAIALAAAQVLGALIMYYLLKDGSLFRRNIVERTSPSLSGDVDWFIGEAYRILRSYGKGRSAISAIVAVVIGLASLLLGLPLVFTIMVVNFIGGYIPYIGAFLGGGLAVIVALGEGGIGTAVVMLLIVLAANLLVENFVEPMVMGETLDIHPLVVLVVTALGGLLGGIVGLILAVPFWVILTTGIQRMRSGGYVEPVTDKAQQTVQRLLESDA
jgi:predicted PurR-regulated permease PerM